VRLTEQMSTKVIENKKNKKGILNRYEIRMENNISFQFKSKVKIKKKLNGSGQVLISFKNQEHLSKILDNFDQ